MALIETLTAKLEADTRQFTAGMTQATQTVQKVEGSFAGFTTSGTNATKATHLLRGAMNQLAFQATGVSGPIGKLSQALLQFGGGTGIVIGVTAAIGLLAAAYQGLTRDTRETEEAQKDLIKQLQGVGIHAQLTAARIELSRLQTKSQAGQTPGEVFSNFLSDMTGGLLGTSRTEQQQRIQRDIASQLNVIAGLSQDVSQWQKKISDDAYETWRSETRRVAALKEGLEVMLRIKAAQETPGFTKNRTGFEVFKTLEGKDIAFKGAEEDQFLEALRRLGESAGKQFALSLITGIQSMQDLLKSVLLQFLSIGLDQVFGEIFHGFFGGGSPGGGTATLSKDVTGMGKASFALQTGGGLPAPTTPFAVMRDADWQRYLTGSLLVARSNGFRP
jgi:hypothetical protein